MAAMSLTDVDNIEGTFIMAELSDYIGTKLNISASSSHQKFLVFSGEEDYEPDSYQTLFSSVGPSLLTPRINKDAAKIALQHLDISLSLPILAQFWVPVAIGGRRYLSTSDQPFGLTCLREGLCWYRDHCLNYLYQSNNMVADEEINIGTKESVVCTGPPSRVFSNGLPEYSPNVEFYSKTEYPMRDEAKRCRIKNYMAVPVFGPISQQCTGVLELVSAPGLTEEVDKPANVFGIISTALQGAGLRTSNLTSHFNMEKELAKSSTGTSNALRDIRKALQVACLSHNLPFAQTWIPRSGENQSCIGGAHVLVTSSDEYYLLDTRFSLLRDTCKSFQLFRGRGVVWTAFSSGNLCFCRDIAMLSIAEYSFAHVARKVHIDSSFAICLKSNHTAENVYVLELFLPFKTADPQLVLETVLLTMKKHLSGFRLFSGKQLGDEMHVEVLRVSKDDKLDFLRLFNSADGSVELQDYHNSSMHQQLFSDDGTGCEFSTIDNAKITADEEQEPLGSFDLKCSLEYEMHVEVLGDSEGNRLDLFRFVHAADGSVDLQDHHNSSMHPQLFLDDGKGLEFSMTDNARITTNEVEEPKESSDFENLHEVGASVSKSSAVVNNDPTGWKEGPSDTRSGKDGSCYIKSSALMSRFPNKDYELNKNSITNPKVDSSDTKSSGSSASKLKGIDRETIEKLFHLKQKDAARILGANISTLKRKCWKFGIKSWPRKKNQATCSAPGVESNTCREKHNPEYGQEGLNSNMSAEEGGSSASKLKGIDHETIEKLFHLKQKDAARILGVNISTLKRKCRKFGIKSWPRKKNQATCSTSGIESNTCSEKHNPEYGQENLNSNMSAEEGMTSSVVVNNDLIGGKEDPSDTRSGKDGSCYIKSSALKSRSPDKDYALNKISITDPKIDSSDTNAGGSSASKLKGIDHETIEKLFHLKQKDAARILGVNISTLKRKCRKFGIKSWPCKKNQATCSALGIESNTCSEKHNPEYGQEGLNSNMFAEEGTTSSEVVNNDLTGGKDDPSDTRSRKDGCCYINSSALRRKFGIKIKRN